MKLKADERSMLQSILADVVPACEVRAFGSRVHGNRLKPFSDIDLAVMSPTPLPLHMLDELHERFTASDLPYKVDVMGYTAASTSFQNIIDQHYEVVQQPGVESYD